MRESGPLRSRRTSRSRCGNRRDSAAAAARRCRGLPPARIAPARTPESSRCTFGPEAVDLGDVDAETRRTAHRWAGVRRGRHGRRLRCVRVAAPCATASAARRRPPAARFLQRFPPGASRAASSRFRRFRFFLRRFRFFSALWLLPAPPPASASFAGSPLPRRASDSLADFGDSLAGLASLPGGSFSVLRRSPPRPPSSRSGRPRPPCRRP